MKKALVVLLILAIAGGVFAQSVSVAGSVNAGLGMLKYDGEDDPFFGVIAHNQGHNGVRGQVDVNGRNKDGDAGFSFRLRAAAAPHKPTDALGTDNFVNNFQFRWAYGWLKAFDGLLEVRAGRIQGSKYTPLDVITDGDPSLFDSYGMILYVAPIDMVSFGVGAYTNRGLGEYDILDTFNMHGWAGFGVNLDVAEIRAEMRAAGNDVHAYISAGISVLDILPIKLTVGLSDISNFSDYGMLAFYPQIGLNIIQDLGINLAGAIWLPQEDDKDVSFRAWAWVTFALGNVIPRLDVNYVMGGKFNPNNGLYKPSVVSSTWFTARPTFDKDHAVLTISPSCLMRVASNMHFELGYLLGVDMSKNDEVAIGGKNKGINHAAFIDMRVSF